MHRRSRPHLQTPKPDHVELVIDIICITSQKSNSYISLVFSAHRVGFRVDCADSRLKRSGINLHIGTDQYIAYKMTWIEHNCG